MFDVVVCRCVCVWVHGAWRKGGHMPAGKRAVLGLQPRVSTERTPKLPSLSHFLTRGLGHQLVRPVSAFTPLIRGLGHPQVRPASACTICQHKGYDTITRDTAGITDDAHPAGMAPMLVLAPTVVTHGSRRTPYPPRLACCQCAARSPCVDRIQYRRGPALVRSLPRSGWVLPNPVVHERDHRKGIALGLHVGDQQTAPGLSPSQGRVTARLPKLPQGPPNPRRGP